MTKQALLMCPRSSRELVVLVWGKYWSPGGFGEEYYDIWIMFVKNKRFIKLIQINMFCFSYQCKNAAQSRKTN